MRHSSLRKRPRPALVPPLSLALALALAPLAGATPALATPTDPPSATAPEANRAKAEITIEPMDDDATAGAYCLLGAAATMGAAMVLSPAQTIMLVSGAMFVPATTPGLMIPLFAILGTAGCSVAAGSQQALSWAIEQSGNIGTAGLSAVGLGAPPPADPASGKDPGDKGDKGQPGPAEAAAGIRPMNKNEMQSAGCLGGALGGLAASMAASPTQVAMLSSGALTIPPSTGILLLGMVSGITVAGCVIGNYAVVPVLAAVRNIGPITDAVFGGLERAGQSIGHGAQSAVTGLAAPSPAANGADGVRSH